jgi:protein phosphatase 1 regulatory subunit 21
VVDEQAKNTELTSTLQMRDQTIRKLEQEVDSLNFRNKQLEKRIGVLQNELGELTAKGNKSRNNKAVHTHHETSAAPSSSSSSLDYELIAKIEENMKLQKQVKLYNVTFIRYLN